MTLIELVIVYAIIAVLVGIVWVVMVPARERARQAVRISNLTQIGHAFWMYREGWEGTEPQKGVQVEYNLSLSPILDHYQYILVRLNFLLSVYRRFFPPHEKFFERLRSCALVLLPAYSLCKSAKLLVGPIRYPNFWSWIKLY